VDEIRPLRRIDVDSPKSLPILVARVDAHDP
jgi:hypothetical protein